MGDGRDADTGFLTRTLVKHGRVTHVLTPQYRLSSNAGGRFPAALQDAVTAYVHLTEKLRMRRPRASPSPVTAPAATSRSACCATSPSTGPTWACRGPGGVPRLWSPWPTSARRWTTTGLDLSPQAHSDYLVSSRRTGAARSPCPSKGAADSPYVSHLGHAFESKSPIFVQTGRAEVLYDDDAEIAQQFAKYKGTKVKLLVQRNVPHDIILVGPVIGFHVEAAEAAKEAGEFLRANRFD